MSTCIYSCTTKDVVHALNFDMLVFAVLRVLRMTPEKAFVVSGSLPIGHHTSITSKSDFTPNRRVEHGLAVRTLASRGHRVFDARPLASAIVKLSKKEPSSTVDMEEFWRMTFASKYVEAMCFLPGWPLHDDERREHALVWDYGVPRKYFREGFATAGSDRPIFTSEAPSQLNTASSPKDHVALREREQRKRRILAIGHQEILVPGGKVELPDGRRGFYVGDNQDTWHAIIMVDGKKTEVDPRCLRVIHLEATQLSGSAIILEFPKP